MSYEDDQDLINDLARDNRHLKRVLRMVLAFYTVGRPVPLETRELWLEIIGQEDMTTKAMCDAIRRALGEGGC